MESNDFKTEVVNLLFGETEFCTPNIQYESIYSFKSEGVYDPHNIRIWITEDSLGSKKNQERFLAEYRLKGKSNIYIRMKMTQKEVLEDIMKFNNVAAVEVVDSMGEGVLVYPDWH